MLHAADVYGSNPGCLRTFGAATLETVNMRNRLGIGLIIALLTATASAQGVGLGGSRPKFGHMPMRRPSAPVESALEWLAKNQAKDGSLPADFHEKKSRRKGVAGQPERTIGTTALGMLAFLGNGITPKEGRHKKSVARGIAWLLEQQADDGSFGANKHDAHLLDHILATCAVLEAHGLAPTDARGKQAQQAIDWLLAQRSDDGAWGKDAPNARTTAWALTAVRSADEFGLKVPDDVLQRAAAWLVKQTGGDGRVGRASKHAELETAAAMLGRHFARDNTVARGAGPSEQLLVKKLPEWNFKAGKVDCEYWYFATYALYQQGGKSWRAWSRPMHDIAVKSQHQKGKYKGSWDPVGVRGSEGGRVYTTALMAINLQVYNRYGRLAR